MTEYLICKNTFSTLNNTKNNTAAYNQPWLDLHYHWGITPASLSKDRRERGDKKKQIKQFLLCCGKCRNIQASIHLVSFDTQFTCFKVAQVALQASTWSKNKIPHTSFHCCFKVFSVFAIRKKKTNKKTLYFKWKVCRFGLQFTNITPSLLLHGDVRDRHAVVSVTSADQWGGISACLWHKHKSNSSQMNHSQDKGKECTEFLRKLFKG